MLAYREESAHPIRVDPPVRGRSELGLGRVESVLTRQEVIPLLGTVMVAPITSTIRGAPGEVVVGVREGLKGDSAVNLDHVQTVDKSRLRKFVGTLGREQMAGVCRALAIATGCAS